MFENIKAKKVYEEAKKLREEYVLQLELLHEKMQEANTLLSQIHSIKDELLKGLTDDDVDEYSSNAVDIDIDNINLDNENDVNNIS